MNVKFIIMAITVGIFIVSGCTGTNTNTENTSAQANTSNTVDYSVPPIVTQTYAEFVETYKDKVGAGLTVCIKGTEIVYLVTGSTGDQAETQYFDSQGNSIGEFIQTSLEQTPPIDLSSYDCVIAQQEEGTLNPQTE